MSEPADPQTFRPTGPLRGSLRAPGDKSIGHRALICAAMAVGESRISGLDVSGDIAATARALAAMGAVLKRHGADWSVHGVGVGGLLQPAGVIDMGNSGTGARLLIGLAASHTIEAVFTGDASLRRRPMDRIIEPLGRIGADFTASPGGRLPLTVRGAMPAMPIGYRLPLPSAQVKSAILCAALNTPGTTRIVEPEPSRDHSERMLACFGAEIVVGEEKGERVIELTGEADLTAQDIAIPGDPSSAAFPLVAALIVQGSDVTIENVCINPTRTGLFDVLLEMGADITYENTRDLDGEAVADIRARHSSLNAVDVPPEIAPRMIDEYPILFVAASIAEGRTEARALGELRYKESDRLEAMAIALEALGIAVERFDDRLAITGSGGNPLGGPEAVPLDAAGDHRIAMSLAIAGLASRGGVTIDDMRPVATSYPAFAADLAALGPEA
ncbi:MAG: 3-phosphoshikimate 1-carboxyvinyltransferase [Sphingomonadales bacterium]|nr:3-phosphoshikimate 1-carboxyvinyltransferase [Sphingomonadales bacterium]